MTEQEKNYEEIKKQLAVHDAKFLMMFEELRQQREDMRRLWERQDAVQAKHDADMKAAQAKHDSDMKAAQAKHDAEMHEMNKKIDETFQTLLKQIHTNFVQTILGVGAIMAAVGGLIIAALK